MTLTPTQARTEEPPKYEARPPSEHSACRVYAASRNEHFRADRQHHGDDNAPGLRCTCWRT